MVIIAAILILFGVLTYSMCAAAGRSDQQMEKFFGENR